MTPVVLVALWTLSRAGYASTVMAPADSCAKVATQILLYQDMRFPSSIMRATCAGHKINPPHFIGYRSRVAIIKSEPPVLELEQFPFLAKN